VVKADVQGSLEPIVNSLKDLSSEETRINILHAETGNIGENDVMLAAASKAVVIGFNVQADAAAYRIAESERVSIRTYEIIYRLLEDVEKALKGLLEPEEREVVIGHADVRALFKVSKIGFVAGCRVIDGELRRNGRIRVLRNQQVIADGEIGSLRHLQDDVREVRQGFECGVSLKGFTEFEVGDMLECYIREKVLI
jgi:translation initiation factor IF-2